MVHSAPSPRVLEKMKAFTTGVRKGFAQIAKSIWDADVRVVPTITGLVRGINSSLLSPLERFGGEVLAVLVRPAVGKC